jgi:hypothetical protein
LNPARICESSRRDLPVVEPRYSSASNAFFGHAQPARETDLPNEFNRIQPTGNSLLFIRINVKPLGKKYFCLSELKTGL